MTELNTHPFSFDNGTRSLIGFFRMFYKPKMSTMKTIAIFLSLSIFVVSCTSVRTFDETTANYDDIYYNPADEKAPATKPVTPPAQAYQLKETQPETRVIEPQSPSIPDQDQSDLSDRPVTAQQNDPGYAADGNSYEEHFGRINGNRSYNRGYSDGYEDALDDQYYAGDPYTYRTPVYTNTWRRGWNRPYYRSNPRNNIWFGYSHRSGWRYGYSYGWGYDGWNCYGPAWYDPYPFGYGYSGYVGYGGWGNSWYGHSGYGWGTPWYGYGGSYYRPYMHHPHYGYGGGYRVVHRPGVINPGGSGGGSGSGGGVIINNPGNGTVNGPRTTVGSNGPTIGRNDPSAPRGRSGKLEMPGNDGAMNPTQGGLKESVARPESDNGRQTVDGNDQGRNAKPNESGPTKSDDRPVVNNPQTKPEQGRPSVGAYRTPVSSDRPTPGSTVPASSGNQVREYKPNQPVSVPSAQPGREGRNANERTQPNPSREYHPSRESVPSRDQNVRPSQPRQESRPQPSYTPSPQRSQPSWSPQQPSSGNYSRESSPSPSRTSSPGGSGGSSSSGRGRSPR